MVLVVIGAVFLIGAGFWRSLPNGLRMFAAFLGGAVVLAGALFMLSVPLLAKNAKAISPPVSLQIRVSGQPGLRFQGSWAIATLGGSSSGGALEGLTPRLYTISQPGDLGVELRRISSKGHARGNGLCILGKHGHTKHEEGPGEDDGAAQKCGKHA